MLDHLVQDFRDNVPDRSAVSSWDRSLSFAELSGAVDRLAELLAASDGPIATLLPASADYTIIFLTALQLGRPIMPLAPDMPHDRLAKVFSSVMPDIVFAGPDFIRDGDQALSLEDMNCQGLTASDLLQRPWMAGKTSFRTAAKLPPDCAYLITTSGSTGEPKLIAGSRAGLEHFIAWEASQIDGNVVRRVSFLAPPVFDVSLRDMLLPLATGGTLCVPDPRILLDASQLLTWLGKSGVEMMHIVPTLLRTLLALPQTEIDDSGAQLKVVASAGEPLFKSDVDLLRKKYGSQIDVLNLYGPSETSLAKSCYKVPQICPEMSPLAIGYPLPDTDIQIISEDGRPAAEGATGQIAIYTDFPSLGYCQGNEVVPLPTIELDGKHFFPTGDTGRVDESGLLLILGRSDRQVKVRGQRVDLGEIESQLRALNGVENACVVAIKSGSGQAVLAAYVVAADRAPPNVSEIRRALEINLPEYMIPNRFSFLEALPLTKSGKIAVGDLPSLSAARPELAQSFVPPISDTERRLAEIWERHLAIQGVGINDTFFDLGGSSIQAQELVADIRSEFERSMPVATFFEHPTISGLAACIDSEGVRKPDVLRRSARSADFSTDGTRDIAIVGMAGSFPEASDVDEFWRNLLNGRDCISHLNAEELDPSLDSRLVSQENYIRARGLMPNVEAFDAKHFGVTPREAEVMDPQQRIFLQTCWHVLEDAAIDPDRFGGEIGIFAGCGDNTYLWNFVLPNRESLQALGEHQIHLANERDYLATRVAYKLDLRGPAINVSTGCSTSLVAVVQAVDNLRAGRCDAALAGGVFVPAPHRAGYLYQEGGFGSADGKCKPFDRNANGTVFSSGSAAVLLKRLGDAERDRDRIYAVLKGAALNNDGREKMSFMAPSVSGQRNVISAALSDAGVNGEDVSIIEAHGTATPIGDPIEVAALGEALGGPSSERRLLGSVKANVGHLDAAAGVTGLIKLALSLHHNKLPGTAHFESPNPELELDSRGFDVPAQVTSISALDKPLLAGVSSFGVGGTNAHVVVSSHESTSLADDDRIQSELVLISAPDTDRLAAVANQFRDALAELVPTELSNAAYSIARGRRRQALRGYSIAEVNKSFSTEDVVRTAQEPLASPDVVFAFPGQGSQHIGMGAGLYAKSPVFREVFDYGADYLAPTLNIDLRELLFETSSETDAAEKQLTDTRIAQPALYLIQFAMAKYWMSIGVRPTAVLGHSIGEFAAATVAGVMNFDTGLKLVELRGRLLQEQPPGSMVSVRANDIDISSLLPDGVVIAAVNAPELCVISGDDDSIRDAEEILSRSGIEYRSLITSHAFHSPMMEPARREFESAVRDVQLDSPNINFISTVTGDVLGKQDVCNPSYWGGQLRHAVVFRDAMSTVWGSDKQVLLEVGPRAVLSTLARQQVVNRKTQRVVASMSGKSNSADEYKDIVRASGELWINGVELDIDAVYRGQSRSVVSLPNYPFRDTRYWIGREFNNVDPLLSEADSDEQIGPVASALFSLIRKGAGISLHASDLDRTFLDIGLDSLFLTQFGIQLQREFGVHVGLREMVEKYSTVRALCTVVESEKSDFADTQNGENPPDANEPSYLPPDAGAFVGKTKDGRLAWFTQTPGDVDRFVEVTQE